MTTREIILGWLYQKENRDKLPKKQVTQTEYEAFENYGHVLKYENEEVGCIGKQYFRLIKK